MLNDLDPPDGVKHRDREPAEVGIVLTRSPDGEKDIEYFISPDNACMTQLHLQSGQFAIFFADDAHRPQITDHKVDNVYKAVIKIDRSLLDM